MRCVAFQTEHFGFDGRGPEIRRFIHDRDRIVAGTFTDRAQPPANITGVEYYWFERPDLSWVVFEGMQVIQVVPEEVCSYWFHVEGQDYRRGFSGITEIHDSAWKAGFAQRHLDGIRHFVLEFYDDIVEVLCKSLAFGTGEFRIESHPELSFYTPWPPK
jgi:hypothetical protein